MPITEAQKRAQKRYVEKNRERIAEYNAKYWQQYKLRKLKPTKLEELPWKDYAKHLNSDLISDQPSSA